MPKLELAKERLLLLMRHAKSSWDNPGWSDHDRPLNERGMRDAPRMGHFLSEHGLEPSLIVSSTAIRARQTAERVAEVCRYTGPIVFEPQLYHASTSDWSHVFARLPDEHHRVLCVGHNPGLEQLLKSWTGDEIEMPTAALAVADVRVSEWSVYSSRAVSVSAVYRPRELDEGEGS
jgi:phosphohistidine phosphatase